MHRTLDDFESATGWAIIDGGDATENIAVSTVSVQGTYSLEFDKKNGTGIFIGGAQKTYTAPLARDLKDAKPSDFICWSCYLSATTDVVNSFIRLGTDSSNYATWTYADSLHTAGMFTYCRMPFQQHMPTGTGIDRDKITYIAVGVTFDGEDDTLADIKFDDVHLHKSILVLSG